MAVASYYQARKATIDARAAKWRLDNRERYRQMQRNAARARRSADPEKARVESREAARRRRLRVHGLSTVEYDLLLKAQSARCAICRTDNPGGRVGVFAIDHDHVTGRVRGLLCDPCNRTLGVIKDSTDWLDSAKKYLGGA